VEFFCGGALGQGWADGLQDDDAGRWWPQFDREVMVASLVDTAQRHFWRE
jgi:hypothetical protein